MARPSTLAERNLLFHGKWVAEYRVSDNLMKSIGTDITSKPSRDCKLSLTTAGLVLETLPTDDGKPGKTEQIAMDTIRDIAINTHNHKCLLIIYVDPTQKFSVIACSSQDEKDLFEIASAYKNHKMSILQSRQRYPSDSQSPQNWTLRSSTVISHPDTRLHANGIVTTNGLSEDHIASQTGGANFSYRNFSNGSDNLDGDVFMDDVTVRHEPEAVQREPVDLNGDGEPEAFNVGIQAAQGDDISVAESTISSQSFQVLREDLNTLSEEMKAIKFLLEKSTGISAEEYYRRRDMHGNKHAVAFHPVPKVMGQPDSNHETTVQNGDKNNNNDDDVFDLRSVGQQTLQSSKAVQQRRYAKNAVSVTTSNANKEKMTILRKRGGIGSGSGSNSGGSGSFSEVPDSSVVTYREVPVNRPGSQRNRWSANLKQPNRYSSSTVTRSIEDVYQPRGSLRRTASGASGRPARMVFLPPARPT